jgi:hypothetical protein
MRFVTIVWALLLIVGCQNEEEKSSAGPIATTAELRETLHQELTKTVTVSMEEFILELPSEDFVQTALLLAKYANQKLTLNPEMSAGVDSIFRGFAAAAGHRDPLQRAALLRDAKRDLKHLLGMVRYADYEQFENEWLRQLKTD